MPESANQTAQQRRANWVGLRTLRQRPKLVGETAGGTPVYEVRSVRLVLPGNGSHFSRLVRCSKCGAEVPGGPVLTVADLDRPSHSVICTECVRSAGVAVLRKPLSRPAAADAPVPQPAADTGQPEAPEATVAPEPAEAAQPAETAQAPEPAEQPSAAAEPPAPAPAVDDGRMAAIEEQLQSALRKVTELADVQRSESSMRSEGDEAVQAQVQAAVLQSLAQLRAEVMASAEAGAARMATLEESLRRSVADVASALQSRREEATSLAAALDQIRSDVEQVANDVQQLGRAQGDLDRRVDELGERMSGQTTATALNEAELRIVESLQQARTHMTSLEEQLRRDVASLTQMAESQRVELENALDGRLREELTTVATVVDEAGLAQAQLARRVNELVQQVAATEAKVESLASSAEAGAGRLRALELGMQESVHRLTEDVRAQRHAVLASSVPEGDPTGPVDLLDALERQLQQAETRLARLGDVG